MAGCIAGRAPACRAPGSSAPSRRGAWFTATFAAVIGVEGTGGSAAAPPAAGGLDARVAPSVYRPHLDGLRAVAVYLVVLFHAGIGRFDGGFIGVDVFFVLSGFLVTQLLLRDLAGAGSIRFARFYARRFRRLLPAAFVALVVTALLFVAVDPVEALASVRSFQAAFLYSANWYFIGASTDYFGADVATNPVLHFWSLAVEEQFYLVWPLLLGGLFWVTGRLRRHADGRGPRRSPPPPSPRWPGPCTCAPTTRTGPTSAPTPAPTSCWPAPSSPSCPAWWRRSGATSRAGADVVALGRRRRVGRRRVLPRRGATPSSGA